MPEDLFYRVPGVVYIESPPLESSQRKLKRKEQRNTGTMSIRPMNDVSTTSVPLQINLNF